MTPSEPKVEKKAEKKVKTKTEKKPEKKTPEPAVTEKNMETAGEAEKKQNAHKRRRRRRKKTQTAPDQQTVKQHVSNSSGE